MYKFFLSVFLSLFIFFLCLSPTLSPVLAASDASARFWDIQSIDTVKYSRDVAREKAKDTSFDNVIDAQVKSIADTGATHIALGTPYDEEFVPFLSRWVSAARKYGLLVWYRGNWSGWEGWFGYSTITPKQHLSQSIQFIKSHDYLFKDGDIFSACPECENGAMGDPRQTGRVEEYRQFLVDLTLGCDSAALQINRQIICNFHSMNGDVAKLVMDAPTTKKLGGVVVIDHYVSTPQQLVSDIQNLAKTSGGKVVLGEFGAPIPDIHGYMTESQQADWVNKALNLLIDTPDLIGLNYWTNQGGSTALWSGNGQSKQVVSRLTAIYRPNELLIQVKNRLDEPLPSKGHYANRIFSSDSQGLIHIPKRSDSAQIPVVEVQSLGYENQGVSLGTSQTQIDIIMTKTHESLWFKLRGLIYKLSHSIIH